MARISGIIKKNYFPTYNFASLFLSGLAAVILLAVWLERSGPLQGVLSESHLHDLGKLLFAFSVFWAYIWFSQYMLIWYTDIPEETSYFVLRQKTGWFPIFILNVILNWVIPFLVLLRRDTKRQRQTIALVDHPCHWPPMHDGNDLATEGNLRGKIV